MNRIAIMILLLSLSCKQEYNDDYYSDEKNKTEFIELNLPKFDNWVECYSNLKVKNRFDEFFIGNKMITSSVYLNKATIVNLDSINEIEIEDYAIFFINKFEQKWKLNGSDLERLFRVVKRKTNFNNVNIDEALEKAYSDTLFLKPERPIIIEEYKLNENILSAVMITKPYYDDHNYIRVYVNNLIIIKNHLVYGGYYIGLNGKESIERAKLNNKIIMSKFLEINQ